MARLGLLSLILVGTPGDHRTLANVATSPLDSPIQKMHYEGFEPGYLTSKHGFSCRGYDRSALTFCLCSFIMHLMSCVLLQHSLLLPHMSCFLIVRVQALLRMCPFGYKPERKVIRREVQHVQCDLRDGKSCLTPGYPCLSIIP